MPVICITLRGPRENPGNMIIINAASAQLAQPVRQCRTGGYLQRISSMGVFGQASNSFPGASEERLGQGTGFWAASAA